MRHPKQTIYLTCTRLKGHKKRHIDVCRKCRWNKTCAAYQGYCQPLLPLGDHPPPPPQYPAPSAFNLVSGPRSASRAEALLKQVRKELEEIRTLLGKP